MSYMLFRGNPMKMNRFFATIALLTVATACTAERAVAPKASAPSFVTSLTSAAPQVPLLFVVDGVKYQRDQVPELSADQVVDVRVMKGRAALKAYGPDASYGVVVVTTRHAAAPRS
jgi:hypothetical protein